MIDEAPFPGFSAAESRLMRASDRADAQRFRPGRVGEPRGRARKPLSDELRARAVELYARGWNCRKTADHLGISDVRLARELGEA